MARTMKISDGERLTFSEMLMQSLILHMRRVRLCGRAQGHGAVHQPGLQSPDGCSGNHSV